MGVRCTIQKILFFVSIILGGFLGVFAQESDPTFADEKYYLIDSLDLSKVGANDIYLLDSILKIYHEPVSGDSIQLECVLFLAEELADANIWPRYNQYLHDHVKEKLKDYPDNEHFLGCYGVSLNYIAFAKAENYEVEEAISLYKQAQDIAFRINDTISIAMSHVNLGFVYLRQSYSAGALDEYLKALDIMENRGDDQALVSIFTGIAQAYSSQNDNYKALEYLNKSLNVNNGDYPIYQKARTLSEIAMLESQLGLGKRGVDFWNLTLSACYESGDQLQIANAHRFMGEFLQDSVPNEALEHFYKSLDFSKKSRYQAGVVVAKLRIGQVEFKVGNRKKGLETALEGFEMAKGHKSMQHKRFAADILKEMYENAGEWKKAYEYQKYYYLINDSIFSKESKSELIHQGEKFAYEKQKLNDDKENEKRLALEVQEKDQKQVQLYYTIGGIVFLLFGLVMLFLRLKTTREQKRIIEQQAGKLKELDRAKTTFFNNVAHELRTPLTLMTGHMESMLSERFGGLNDNQRKSVQVAKSNSTKLNEMISEILDLGKLESSKLELTKKEVAIKPFLDRIFYTFESLAFQFEIDLVFDYSVEDNLRFLWDEKKIEKALNNLIYNAIKFTPRGGKVSLNIRHDANSNELWLDVKDTGPGIAASNKEQIFERYYQVSDEKMIASGGTGIGLTIAREFVQLHNGALSEISKEGEGATFRIKLPFEPITAEPEVNTKLEEGMDELVFPVYPILETSKFTILVVEDHKQMQQYLKDILSDFANVLVASDGLEALKMLDKNKVDLLTIDVMMPNMDGFKFLKEVKSKSEYALIPTIMLTARAAEMDKLDALSIGVNDYITKPFSEQELIARIANLLENSQERLKALLEDKTEPTKPASIQSDEKKSSLEERTADGTFLQSLKELVEKNLSDSEYKLANLSKDLGMSERQMIRNVKRISGLTPTKYIREIKLLTALDLLKSKRHSSVAEVSYAVGFEKPSYFAQLFLSRFGKKPSDYFS